MHLTEDALEFARRHISAFYDTDFFPKPFEFSALWHCWEEVKTYLLKTPLKEVLSAQPKVVAWHKARGGYRVVHQLDPVDAIIYTALAYLIAGKVEAARMGPHVSCAYRIEVSSNSFFSRGSGFDIYRKNCERLAEEYDYVLATDISDFYNQIYLHRVRNALEDIGAESDLAQEIESFLMRLNHKASQGLPIGPAASIILAEAALIDVDQFIHQHGLEHVRYVDDFRIFANSEGKLKAVLEELVVYLHQQHRLGLVSEKTKIHESQAFVHEELKNAYQLEKLDLMRSIEAGNQYGEFTSDDDDSQFEDDGFDDDEEDDPTPLGDRLAEALSRARDSGVLDLGVIRAIIRRAKHARDSTIVTLLCDDLSFYLPVINDIALYFDSLFSFDHDEVCDALSDACDKGHLANQGAKVWIGWYLARHVEKLDFTLRTYLQSCDVPTITIAELAKKNLSWSKAAKHKVSSSASWDRRAYLYSLSGLSTDERKVSLHTIGRTVALTQLDSWVLKWVSNGAPDSKPAPH